MVVAERPLGRRYREQRDLFVGQPGRSPDGCRLVGAHRLLAQQRGRGPHLAAPARLGERFPGELLRQLGHPIFSTSAARSCGHRTTCRVAWSFRPGLRSRCVHVTEVRHGRYAERASSRLSSLAVSGTLKETDSDGISGAFRIRGQDGGCRRGEDLHVHAGHVDPGVHGGRPPVAGRGVRRDDHRPDRLAPPGRGLVSGRLLHALSARFRPAHGRVRVDARSRWSTSARA